MTRGANQFMNPFTDEQYALLERMVAEDKSWSEIGEACGHSPASCSTTYSVRKNGGPPKIGPHRLWAAEDLARLKHMRDVHHMGFSQIGRELGRTASSCNTKYNVATDDPTPLHGMPEPGARITVTPAALADRDARYRLWLQQSPVAALMGDPLPGRSALDQKRSMQA